VVDEGWDEGRLRRAVDAFRVAALVYAAVLHAIAHDEYRRPWAGWIVLGVLAVWTAFLVLHPKKAGTQTAQGGCALAHHGFQFIPGTPQGLLRLPPLVQVITDFVLALPRSERGANRADQSCRAKWPFEQGNISERSKRTHRKFRRRRADSSAGEDDHREIGPGRLLREMVCKQTDGLVLQDLLGDDGRPGTFGDC